jgi:NAD(P)-dependent dehydrogenase (short-subunit alcohol dehydrogenase family)
MASLSGKVIAVTGAASGIGLATAKRLAAKGCSLALADRNRSRLGEVLQTIEAESRGTITTHEVDVRHREQVRSFLLQAKQQHGTINGCANIAGVIGKGSNIQNIWEVPVEEYKTTMEVNADGTFHCLAEQLQPGFLEKGGSIVNMSSLAGLLGLGKNSAYCASKWAVIGMTKAAAKEAGSLGIRVNCVAP